MTTTVQADITALVFTSPELATMLARSTSGTLLKAVSTQLVADLNNSLQVAYGMCAGPNQTNIAAIQAKLLP